MESLRKSCAFTDDDFDLFKSENLEPPNTIIYTNTSCLTDEPWLKSDNESKKRKWDSKQWSEQLDKMISAGTPGDDHLAVVISPRAKPPADLVGEDIEDHPAALEYLSMSSELFKAIVRRMSLHRALAVLVDRGSPVISRIQCTMNGALCQVYTLRVEHALDHQTAITITHFPIPKRVGGNQDASHTGTGKENGSSAETPSPGRSSNSSPTTTQPAATEVSPSGCKTHAMILGYDDKDVAVLTKILKACKDSIFSPFTLIKAFLHVESRRRFKEVNHKVAQFQHILVNYERLPLGQDASAADEKQKPWRVSAQDPKNLIGLYIDVCTLKNELTAWRAQVVGFQRHARDFVDEEGDVDPEEYLQRLVDEYEVKINKCDLVLQGASLAFQMETAHLSRVDTQIALRDGKQMKAIALLTMVFLPGTFVATLMAIPEFDGMKQAGDFPMWVWYFILFLPLTAVVLTAYFAWINLYKSKDQKNILSMV